MARLAEQVRHADAKGFGEGLDHPNGRVARRTLQIADIGPVNTGLVSERFLTQRALMAQTTQVIGKAVLDIHTRCKARLSTNDLQTMSDIAVRAL